MRLSDELRNEAGALDKQQLLERNIVKIQAVDNGFIVTVDRGMSYKQLVFQTCEAAELVEEVCKLLGITHLVYDQTPIHHTEDQTAQDQSPSKPATSLSSTDV